MVVQVIVYIVLCVVCCVCVSTIEHLFYSVSCCVTLLFKLLSCLSCVVSVCFYVRAIFCESGHGLGVYCFLLCTSVVVWDASGDLILRCSCCWSQSLYFVLLVLLLSSFLGCCHCRLCIHICWWRARFFSTRFKFAMPDGSLCTGGGFAFCWIHLVQFGGSCFPRRLFFLFVLYVFSVSLFVTASRGW